MSTGSHPVMLASVSVDHTLRHWDVESGQPIGDALKGHIHWVNQVVFSPDKKRLASASID
jgi:WD40 repeat protein